MTNCQSKEKTGSIDPIKKVIVTEYSLFDSLRYSNEFRLEETVSNDMIEYIYRELDLPDSLINYSIT